MSVPTKNSPRPEEIRRLLQARGFSFSKRYGQNFLFDHELLGDIAKNSGAADFPCVEIGCGAGTLTACLAAISERVIGYEIDERLLPVLRETLGGFSNAEVRCEDFLNADLAALESDLGPYVVCANLPYYVTSPVLLRFLEEGKNVRALTVMVQKEVAERLAAAPDDPAYGALTVAVRCAGNAEILGIVNRERFVPAPNVDSAVVRIRIDPEKRARFADPGFRPFVRASFAMRRKTLVNNLAAAYKVSKDRVLACITAAGLPPAVRGEALGEEDFLRLYEMFPGGKTKKPLPKGEKA